MLEGADCTQEGYTAIMWSRKGLHRWVGSGMEIFVKALKIIPAELGVGRS